MICLVLVVDYAPLVVGPAVFSVLFVITIILYVFGKR